MTKPLYKFPEAATAPLDEVGGKGLSLMRMSAAGLPVPPGFVLPVGFFSAWLDTLGRTDEWRAFQAAGDDDLKAACERLKARAQELSFDRTQQELLSPAVGEFPKGSLFAVRSSSPEEDLEGSSFAGGYETVLGVKVDAMESAVRRAFASCLDHRIAVYKREHGFDSRSPKIAVVVQLQIESDIAGVGFSLNPVTNNYDEAVLNANWGLGETVVAGLATPDTYVVDKVTMKVASRKVGAKETSIWLLPDGGTEERADGRHGEPTLSDSQCVALTRLIDRTEKVYGKPMDIEWAIAGKTLYLLQARPITTHVPLPPQLVTAIGEPKRLYIDATISVQGLHKPMSVMATAVLRALVGAMTSRVLGTDLSEAVRSSFLYVTDGRLYANASVALKMVGKERFTRFFANLDPLAAKAVSTADEATYRDTSHMDPGFALRAATHVPAVARAVLRARMWPDRALADSLAERQRYIEEARALTRQDIPTDELSRRLIERTVELIVGHVIPLLVASRIAFERIKKYLGEERADLVRCLESSLPRNPTVEMGLALYQISELVPDGRSPEQLEDDLKSRRLPGDFLTAWDGFLDKYGHRCAGELDIASPRYRDNPRMLLQQLVTLKQSAGAEDNPLTRYRKNLDVRVAAYEKICADLSDTDPGKLRRFKSLYHVWETLGGYREAPKFFLIFAMDLLRQRLLRDADALVREGRLERPEQVFDLTLDNLTGVVASGADLIETGRRNREFIDRLSRVPQLPSVIDSRGLILRPPPSPLKEGEIAGTPISAGVVRGAVKVLNSPDEKPLQRGEILVARATDPGWTPLFVNAAGVVLEIGGMLQHGALVAREYGLPCVAGVAGATTLWQDGTIVEVDGSAGIIRVITPAELRASS